MGFNSAFNELNGGRGKNELEKKYPQVYNF